MAGEIQVNSVTALTESGSNIVLNNVDTATNRTNLGLGSMATQNANAVAITGGSVSGASIVPDSPFSFRNKIINGSLKSAKVINQRGASSITGATGYTFDRWYYDGSTYLYQGIEDANVENGTYAISWVGSGINAAWKVSTDSTAGNGPDATTGFTSVSNGGTFTVNEVTEFSKHLWIRFDGTLSNLDKVQVERDAVTPFEYRPYGLELILAKRYFEKLGLTYSGHWGGTKGPSAAATIYYDVVKRATPDVDDATSRNAQNNTTATVTAAHITTRKFVYDLNANTGNIGDGIHFYATNGIHVNAEL